jgi:uncharacterized membrane protein YqaE (UPF0057 family)
MANQHGISTLLLVIIAILLPPLAVGLAKGVGVHLILSIILTLLFYLPGLLHALWCVLA